MKANIVSTAPVTLVIPAYNRSHLITDTLNSALNQSLRFEEIIVIDDGSTDDTPATLARFGDRITVIRTPNQGVQMARNIGIERARTKLVALLDSDDLLEPDYLQTMAPWMLTHSEHDAVYCNFVTFNSGSTDLDKLARAPFDFLADAKHEGEFAWDVPDLYKRSLLYQPLFTCGLMINKRFVTRHGAYNPDFNRVGAEDWEFTLRLISEGKVAVCKKPLARVRKHEDNDSADQVHMSLGEVKILEYASKHHSMARSHTLEVQESIHKRMLSAMDSAFDRGTLNEVLDIRKRIKGKTGLKCKLKVLICRLPEPARSTVWNWIQNRSK
ncbi:glycosyltransferase family 2 protein [Aquabacterium sp. G14]|uniref:glycosyltransferase family 2 protein n=1 Tax=Aquabacterium sp. G14 TaxID=3130164 RepID=UPI0030B1B636